LNANFQVFRDSVGTSLLQIANEVLPIVTNALQDFVHWWNNLSPGMQKAIVYAAMLVAALGPLLIIIGSIITAIVTVVSAIGSFIGIIGSLIGFIAPLVTALGAVVAAIGVWPIIIAVVLV